MITYPTEAGTENMQIKAIELEVIDKKYPLAKNQGRNMDINFEDFWALKGISFEVSQGQILGIIGRNGAGKTTLLNIIAGTLAPTQGKVLVKGKVLGLFNLGVGFQDELTGRENIFLNGAILGASREEITDKLDSIIEFSELGGFINMPLGSYSQGMRLRLGFSIVINLDFDILAIDEVLAVGDALFQSKCFERLMDFRRSGKTLIVTTQDMGLIERLCDKVVLLDHGHLSYSGQPPEGIDRYRTLLNTEKFFVGPVQKSAKLIENTKKWADNTSEWGKELGTREVIIDSVKFTNKFGWRSSRIRSGEPLKIKVRFSVRNSVKEPHFGIAIFRSDGVYCYGPNTAFDGYNIPELKPGRGYFILNFHKFLLAPGEYRLSVAIWDKNETLAFDYHDGCYKLAVNGKNKARIELLNIPFKFYPRDYIGFTVEHKCEPDLSGLNDKWGRKTGTEESRIGSVKFLNRLGGESSVFTTGEPITLAVNFNGLIRGNKNCYLWLGVYREDGIYCQGIVRKLNNKSRFFKILFPKLFLLPGGYRVSLGVWDNKKQEFIMCHHAAYQFRMVFNKEDHGTVYLEHRWKYKLPSMP